MNNKSKLGRFFSNAEWSFAGKTQDHHSNYEQAHGVCINLINNYRAEPCNHRGWCKKVWVTDEDGLVYFEKLPSEPRG
jgi:hypothetical protein